MDSFDSYKYFGILLLLWNARGINANIVEFQNYLYRSSPHIVCITETMLRNNNKVKFKGFQVFRKDRAEGRGGGIIILIKNGFSAVENNIDIMENGHLEVLSVRVKLDSGWVDIFTFYNPCRNVTSGEFDFYFSQTSVNSILCGDFNAHHTLWNNRDSSVNFTGRQLFQTLLGHVGVNLLTTKGIGTFVDNFGSESTLDLCFGSGRFVEVDEIYRGADLGSDHIPILYGFSSLVLGSKSTVKKWHFKDIDWGKWTRGLLGTFESGKFRCSNLKEFSLSLVEYTKNFADLCSKPFHSKYHKAFWSEECSRAVALRRRAWRNFLKYPTRENKTLFNRQSAISRRTMKSAKRDEWKNFCSTLDFSTSETLIWRLFKSLQGKSSPLSYPIISNGSMLTEHEIVERFADSYAVTFQSRGIILDDSVYRTVVQTTCALGNFSEINCLFRVEELSMALNSLNLNSANGWDHIDNKFLFNLPQKIRLWLPDLLNNSWSRSLFDGDFKKSVLVPIPKPGKDHSKAESYRPIALLSCLGKLFESQSAFNVLFGPGSLAAFSPKTLDISGPNPPGV